ncbi:MAG TPA: hotdog domain-containing protein, partial [Blastocatellia bacterium]
VILSHIDTAGAVEVRKHTSKPIVTVAMREVVFVAPVMVGDLVSFYTDLIKIGRTSITVKVTVEAWRAKLPGERVRVTEAEVVYVAVDEDRKPIPIRDENAE